MDLKNLLYFTIQRNPDREAVVEGNKRLTRTQWGERIYGLANSLKKLGIKKGDRVSLVLKNHEETVTAFMALHCIGAVAVMCNPRSVSERVKYYLKDSESKGVIFEKETSQAVSNALVDIPGCSIHISIDEADPSKNGWFSFDKLCEEGSHEEPTDEVSESDIGIFIYTSGTTGEPKGVPVTHGMSFHRTLANSIGGGCGYGFEVDVPKVIGLMPLFHTVGIHGSFLHAVFYDGTYYPIADFIPDNVISVFEKEKITHSFASPTHFHVLLSAKTWDKSKFASVKQIMYAGAPMPDAQVERCVKEFSPANFIHIYGATETYFMGCLQNGGNYPSTLGPTIFNKARVVKLGGEPDDIAKAGEEGEFITSLRGPETFKGYWNQPDKTAEVCRKGWYYTKDSAVKLENGLIRITGRTDDMILSGAENIHPAEVENYLLRHPNVADAAVVGVPDERWGQIVKAFVVLREGETSAEELDKFFKESSSIEAWKRPKKYQFLKSLPRTPSGKVQRFALRRMEGGLE